MTRLSELQGRRVDDSQGQGLGHVWDLRTLARDADTADDDGRTIAWLLVGRRGLLERLGFKRTAARRIACAQVQAIGAHAVTVREDTVEPRPGASA